MAAAGLKMTVRAGKPPGDGAELFVLNSPPRRGRAV